MRMGLAVAMLLCPLAYSVPAAAQSKVNIEQNFADSLTALPREDLVVSGGFYVPAYSSVAMSQGKLRVDFSVTLSVHNASETQQQIEKDMADGRAADVQGTPTFFVNGKRVANRSVEGFKQMIDEVLKAKG